MATTEERRPLLGQESVQNTTSNEVQLSKCGASICCNPHRAVHRYIVLIFMCLLSFGSYFCYDNPAALQDTMKADMKLSTTQFMAFYSWYSWPNVILCFFGGFLIDKVFGIRLGAVLFSIFVTAGQLLFALGAQIYSYELMCVGRFVFGLGGESLAVAQNTYAVNWFKGKELNMVFGLQLSFSRIGSTVNMNVMQPLYGFMNQFFSGHTNLGIVLFIAAGTCVFSLFCALLMAYFDKRAERILKKEEGKTGEVIRFRDVKDFPATFWVISIICVAYYVTVFPFIGLGLVFFEMKWQYTPGAANAVNSLVYIVSAVASPVFGFLIDRFGKNIFWVMMGVVVTGGCHALLAFTFLNPYIAMVTMGLAYSVLASALWPMVALIVPEYQLGTAYGIMQSVQNLGLAVISLVAGTIVDTAGYLFLEVFFLAWLCLALIACVVLYLIDAARGGNLNLSASVRHKREAEEEIKKSLLEADPVA